MFCSSICHLSLRKKVSSSGTQLTSISISSMRLRCPTHPSALLPQPACLILTISIVEQNPLDLVQSSVVLHQTKKWRPVLADRGRKGKMCKGVIFSSKSIFACHSWAILALFISRQLNMVLPFPSAIFIAILLTLLGPGGRGHICPPCHVFAFIPPSL